MKILILFLCALTLQAQTTVNGGRTFLGPVDASGATSTRPAKLGTAAPSSGACDAAGEEGSLYVRTGNPATVPSQAYVCMKINASAWAWNPIGHMVQDTAPTTCVVGSVWFDSNAVAGQNWFGCTTTDNWTLMSGASSSASTAFAPTRETGSATNDTLRLNCDVAPYCTQTVNRVIAFNTTTDITFKISTSPSYTGNVYIYYTPSAQTIYCDQGSAGLTLTLAGCTAATTGGIPAGSLPVGKYNGTYAVVANAFSDPSTSPVAPTVWSRTLSGTGVDCSDNGSTGEQTCVTDATIPSKTDVATNSLIKAATTGSANAYLLTTPHAFTANANAVCVEFTANFTNSGTATLAVNGETARQLWKHNGTSAAAAAASGEIISGQIYRACHNTALNTSGAWVVQNIGGGGSSGSVATDVIFDAKGDLAAGTADNTSTKLSVSGNNGKILVEDSAQSTGMKWGYITREQTFPAAMCASGVPGNGWGFIIGSEPSGTGACGGGYTTGLPSQPYLYFANGANAYATFSWHLPSTFVSLVSVTYHFAPSGTSGGNVSLKYGAMCFGSSDNWLTGTPSFTDDSIFTVAAGSTQYAEQAATHTTTNTDSCSAPYARVAMKIGREGADGGDTNTNDIFLFGITIKWTERAE